MDKKSKIIIFYKQGLVVSRKFTTVDLSRLRKSMNISLYFWTTQPKSVFWYEIVAYMFFGQGFGKNYWFEFYSYGSDLYSWTYILHIQLRKNQIGHVFGNA